MAGVAGVTKCLSCRRSMPAASGVEASQQPPLCVDCAAEEGVLAAVWLEAVQEASAAQSRLCQAHSLCLRCHSGGSMGPVLCENGECAVRFACCMCVGLCMQTICSLVMKPLLNQLPHMLARYRQLWTLRGGLSRIAVTGLSVNFL